MLPHLPRIPRIPHLPWLPLAPPGYRTPAPWYPPWLFSVDLLNCKFPVAPFFPRVLACPWLDAPRRAFPSPPLGAWIWRFAPLPSRRPMPRALGGSRYISPDPSPLVPTPLVSPPPEPHLSPLAPPKSPCSTPRFHPTPPVTICRPWAPPPCLPHPFPPIPSPLSLGSTCRPWAPPLVCPPAAPETTAPETTAPETTAPWFCPP